jgi:hypothetical protein
MPTAAKSDKKIVTLRLSPKKLQAVQASASSMSAAASSPIGTPEPSKQPLRRKRKKIPGISGMATPSSPFPDDAMPSRGSKSMLAAANAQLRSLDRSGAPCRRWFKQPIELKSFTGFKYKLPAWCGLERRPDRRHSSLPTAPASRAPGGGSDIEIGDAPTSDPPSEMIESEL